MPTLIELYNKDVSEVCRNHLHGRSLLPLIRGKHDNMREGVIFGYFGKQMNVTNGKYTYMRSPAEKNRSLNLYTASLMHNKRFYDCDRMTYPSLIDCGNYLPWTKYPVFRVAADIIKDNAGKNMRFIYLYEWGKKDRLFDISLDYGQNNDISEEESETVELLCRLIAKIIKECDAPKEQFERMRLIKYSREQ